MGIWFCDTGLAQLENYRQLHHNIKIPWKENSRIMFEAIELA